MTESQRLEEQLRQAQKMESVGRLAGGIAHDFNNLLTAIRGYAELMLIDFDTGADPGRDCAEQIARAADRAASLTSQLLAFSRKQVLRPQLIDLNEIVEGMATMLKRMLGEDVLLSTELDPELGPTLADPTQLEQVVLNLAINARDAMPKGGSLVLRTQPLELGEDDELPHPDLVPGAVRHAHGARHRDRHGLESRRPGLRALLHDEGRGRGNRPRARDRPRDREPERRRGLDRLDTRRGHLLHGLSAGCRRRP